MPDETSGSVAESPANTAAAEAPSVDWASHIPQDIAGEKLWEPIKGKPLGDVLKGYAEAQKYIGGAVKLPPKDAKPEDVAKWKAENLAKFSGLLPGPPPDPTGYKVTRPETAADLGWDETAEKDFVAGAHKAGFTQDQLDFVFNWYGQFGAKGVKDVAGEIASATSALQQDWGGNYETFVGRAQRFADTAFSEETKTLIRESGIGRQPSFIKDLLELAGQHVEAGIMPGTPEPGQSVEEIDKLIAEINQELVKSNNDARVKELTDRKHALYQRKLGKDGLKKVMKV